MPQLIKTHALAAHLQQHARAAVAHMVALGQAAPRLAIIQVGENPASAVYIQHKLTQAARVGVQCTVYHFPAQTSQHALQQTLGQLNQDPSVHGVILQLPLPPYLQPDAMLIPLIDTLDPAKDVDGLTTWQQSRLQDIIPATPLGVLRLLEWLQVPLVGVPCAVVGRSRLVGAPLAQLLARAGAIVQTYSKEFPIIPAQVQHCRVVVSAAGVPGLITPALIHPQALVVDVGITRTAAGGVVGDVAADVVQHARAVTAVPGGVGPLTVISLLTNVITAAARQQGGEAPQWRIPVLS